ncbi:MAG: sigma-70 family RNA polymerase sigma factor [Pirellulaceae bacterium]|nr:sigma-70 family RNA polymerase sigma factor [Pirellulaceae bacterium]
MNSADDEFRELIAQVRNGSEEAAWQLVDRYGERVRRAVRRALNQHLRSKFDSLDFVQLVWSSLFRTRNQLDRFEGPNELAAFLITMARNKVGMETRRCLVSLRHNVNREVPLEERTGVIREDLTARGPLPIETAIAREQWDRMVEGQPDGYRRIIELRLRGKTQQEIAQELGVSECTVRRFLKKLCTSTGV